MTIRQALSFGFTVLVFLLYTPRLHTAHAAPCSFPVYPSGGTHELGTSCSITADSLDGLDYANFSETATDNTAVLQIPTGTTVTLSSGVGGTTSLATGSISITGGSLVIGSSNAQLLLNTPLYVDDADADGWPNDLTTFYSATASGRRRKSLMHSLATVDCNDAAGSQSNSCGASGTISINYSGSTLTNHDVVFSMDTATPIAAAEMQSDCGDLRVRDSDDETELDYWIEGGCNTTTTQIWVTVPSIPDGGKTIHYSHDGNAGTANGFESWSGSFTMLYDASCPSGWTRNTDFDSRFPYGATTYGTTAGSASHSHAQVSCSHTNTTWSGGVALVGGSGSASHWSHSHDSIAVDVDTNSSVLPPYLDMVMCESSDLDIDTGLMAMFDNAAPSGWTRFSTLDNTYPRGASTYGGTGGATTHTHTTTGGYTTSAANDTGINAGTFTYTSVANHTHTSVAGSTDAGDNTPPYLDMVFAEIGSEGRGEADMITMVDALPPLGWTRFSALDDSLPRGASSYGGTGGSATHDHTVSITTGAASGNFRITNGGGQHKPQSHTHTCAATTDTQSNLPPYHTAIFAQRNTPLANAAVDLPWNANTSLADSDASFLGEDANDWAGRSVAIAGDVNNDGYDDILIGTYTDDDAGTDAGQVYLILGKASGWAMDTDLSTADASFQGSAGYEAGFDVAGAGDVDGDGYDDILIGATGSNSHTGRVYLILGKGSGWAMDTDLSTADASFLGEDAGDYAGYSVASAGDVDNDGYDDILIGAYRDEEGGSLAGQAYLILGKASGWATNTNLSASDASFLGEDTNDYAGVSVSGAGDVDGDGYDDILIGAYRDEDGGTDAGQSYLILGKASGWAMDTNLSASDASFWGEDSSDFSGSAVSKAGDVNNDGYDDFLITAHRDEDGGTDAGQVYLIFGQASGWAMDTDLSASDASFWGEASSSFTGFALSGGGDINNDGFSDIVIGAYSNDQVGTNAGEVYIILGKASGWAMDTNISTADASFQGEDANDIAGYSIAADGDIDNDGYSDILIGAPIDEEAHTGAGQAYVIFRH